MLNLAEERRAGARWASVAEMRGGDSPPGSAGVGAPRPGLAAPVVAAGGVRTDPHSSPSGSNYEDLASAVMVKTHTFYLGREREKGWLWKTSELP